MKRLAALFTLILVSLVSDCAHAENEPAKILQVMKNELDRSLVRLKAAGEAPVYFLAYRLYEGTWFSTTAENGALRSSSDPHTWGMLNIDLRVGSPQFDNTHAMRSRSWQTAPTVYETTNADYSVMSLENSSDGLKQVLWLKTDEAFKNSQKRLSELRGNNAVLVTEEDSADDFSLEQPHSFSKVQAEPEIDKKHWEDCVRSVSKEFIKYPAIKESSVSFSAEPITRFLVTSEGTQIADQRLYYSISMSVSTLADDGMDLWLYDNVHSENFDKLPAQAELKNMAQHLAASIRKLRDAPAADPYVGPAILSGKAAAVLFHEVLGHRVEGHRQKEESEGRTFARKIGSRIMPSFISVIDDPTCDELHGRKLVGFYGYDDEGVPAQKVVIVDKGVLENFLLSRSPVKGFAHSNGHGRGSPGWNPVARQGNLIVEVKANKQVTDKKLRSLLIEEARRQHKDYGLYFDELAGGSTLTEAGAPQAISLYPLVVYKVYVDGRPDELIRGVDLVGTPLLLLERILAAGQLVETFNGSCGAESGSVPVSATAPSLLIQSVEVQRKAKSLTKQPILPDPTNVSADELSPQNEKSR